MKYPVVALLSPFFLYMGVLFITYGIMALYIPEGALERVETLDVNGSLMFQFPSPYSVFGSAKLFVIEKCRCPKLLIHYMDVHFISSLWEYIRQL